MSADVLRQAASLMRSRADNATGSPWQHIPIEDEEGASDSYVISLTGFTSIGEDVGEGMTEGDAEHIASWHPAVALAVADWLDREADAFDAYMDKQADPERTFSAVWLISARVRHDHALAVATTYLATPPH